MTMSISKKFDFVSNTNLPKWPFWQKIRLYLNFVAAKCTLAIKFTNKMFGKFKIAHIKCTVDFD